MFVVKNLIAFYESLATRESTKPAKINKRGDNTTKLVELYDSQAMANIKKGTAYDSFKAGRRTTKVGARQIDAHVVVSLDQPMLVECRDAVEIDNPPEQMRSGCKDRELVKEIVCSDTIAVKPCKKRVNFDIALNKVHVYEKVEWVD
ncbi:hypothetical protein VCUG_02046 [Vavraia culicis subsp. floridensis]|uniref:Uncharacterized protein n=1 Tax=Vavraia culicis (isolate floridensis) TaxID=948595 RepID=L2GS17_VAVCU|nr:uncharacterized protein VCUG_02046 [Vavraia culicis subsp. floridensis]ELA46451.1 hypothetical protein VCUG_02046 [Vavraia culicis subsp. floridensis]